jgi:hypothetical protein
MLFSRRSIQRMLDQNAEWMRPDQLQEHVKALNDPKQDTLAKLWEVAVLNGLSKFVNISYERETGSYKPDIVYELNEEQVVADIVTISDKDRHKKIL